MNNQRLVVKYEKVKGRDGRLYKILDLQATPMRKLPLAYMATSPRVVLLSSGRVEIVGNKYTEYLEVGDVITPRKMEWCLRAMAEAGDRLHEIRQKIKKEVEGWEGTEMVII